MKAWLRDELGFQIQEIEIPEPQPIVLIWGEQVFVHSYLLDKEDESISYIQVKYHIVPDTSESGAHRLPDFI